MVIIWSTAFYRHVANYKKHIKKDMPEKDTFQWKWSKNKWWVEFLWNLQAVYRYSN